MIVLTFMDYYLPGHKAGGPIRSISNAAAALQPDVEFRVVTRDRDLGDTNTYPDLETDCWSRIDGTDVRHVSPARLGLRGIRDLLCTEKYDIVYLNSVFSVIAVRVLLLRWLRLVPRRPTILAPRGEFSPGALAISASKKLAYIRLLRAGLSRGIRWHGSSHLEVEHIHSAMGTAATAADGDVAMAHEFFSPPPVRELKDRTPKQRGRVRVVFMSRISPKKNLLGAIRLLGGVRADVQVQFDIYGPAEDREYWALCEQAIRDLPANVRVTSHGAVEYAEVASALAGADLFFLPTFGENFGHVILEALAVGTPTLISTETPWRNLAEMSAGWDLPLDKPELFTAVVEQVAALSEDEFLFLRDGARAYAGRVADHTHIRQENLDLFMGVMSRASRTADGQLR